MSRRSKLEIYAEILRIAKEGARKTKIVYNANLNFKILRGYLEELEKASLIDHSGSDHLIKTTEKGNKYLQRFSSLQELGINTSSI